MVDHRLLSAVLIEFSRRRIGDYVAADILDVLCKRVTKVLPVDGAGVMLEGDDGHLHFVAASDDVVRHIETLQIEFGEGPCLLAYSSGEQVVVTDLKLTELFPDFTPRALEVGLAAVYSFPMRFGDERIGALNLYGAQPGPFDGEDRVAAQILADIATTAILNAQTMEQSTQLATQLQHALDTRVIIEQAKGKLSEQIGMDVDTAFAVLRRYARRHGLKVHRVAEDILADRLRLQYPGP